VSRRGFPKSETGDESGTWEWRSISSGSPVFTSNWHSSYVKHAADSIGANSTGWPGNKPVNDYAGYDVNVKVSSAQWTGKAGTPFSLEGGGKYSMISLLPINPLGDNFDASFLEAKLSAWIQQKLIDRIKDQKVNVGVLAAEFHKTCGTVTDAATRIASALRQVKRGNVTGALAVLTGGRHGKGGTRSNPLNHRRKPRNHPPNSGSVSRDWLALQYGWLPLLSDVNGAVEELARTMTYRPPGKTVTVSGAMQDEKNILYESANNFPTIKGVRKYDATARGTVEYEVLSQTAQFIANTGVLNPLSVAWELLPYSFVVDWFLPVGNYLNNLDYDLGLLFTKGWLNFKVKGTWHIGVVSGTYQGNTDARQTWSGGSYDAEVRSFRRTTLTSFPALTVPQWKNPISLKHAANAIALLGSAI
jgi:hypothetical protein